MRAAAFRLRRRALAPALACGLAALLPAAACGQPAAARGQPATASGQPAAAADAAPPAPPLLSPSNAPPPGPPPATASQAGMPTSFSGLRSLPAGGWRLGFEPGADTPSALQRLGLMRLGGALARATTGRVTLWAEVAAGEDVSTTRRLALRRALAVRAVLVAGGLPETRVDIRALGRTEAERDLVDILPFGVTRD